MEKSGSRELTFFELLYGVLFQPKILFKKVAEEPPLFYSFIVIVGVSIITSMLNVITTAPLDMQLPPEIPREVIEFMSVFTSPVFSFMGTLLSLLFTLIFWFITSAIFQLVAEFLGGKGKGLGVMTVLGLASLPQIFIIPFAVLTYIFALPGQLIALVSIILFVWSYIILPILGFREVQQFSLGRALLTVFMPFIFTVAMLIILMVSIMSLIIPFLG